MGRPFQTDLGGFTPSQVFSVILSLEVDIDKLDKVIYKAMARSFSSYGEGFSPGYKRGAQLEGPRLWWRI